MGLGEKMLVFISLFFKIEILVLKVVLEICGIFEKVGLDVLLLFEEFECCLVYIFDVGFDLDIFMFEVDFGCKFEYYIGFVFELMFFYLDDYV